MGACPSLEQLDLTCVVRRGADVSALANLPSGLRALSIGGDGFADAAASLLARHTQLRDLNWYESPELTQQGLQQLTALTALNRLEVVWCDSISFRNSDLIGGQYLRLESGDAIGQRRGGMGQVSVPASQVGARAECVSASSAHNGQRLGCGRHDVVGVPALRLISGQEQQHGTGHVCECSKYSWQRHRWCYQ